MVPRFKHYLQIFIGMEKMENCISSGAWGGRGSAHSLQLSTIKIIKFVSEVLAIYQFRSALQS